MTEELHDFYYSEYGAAYSKGHCHKVNGIKFTESVRQGRQPVDKTAVLVASGIPRNNNTITYDKQLLSQVKATRLPFDRPNPQGKIMQIVEENENNSK